LLRGEAAYQISLAVAEKNWKGSTLSFMLRAKMDLLSTPIRGTVEATDHDIVVDADLGLLNRIVSENAVREVSGERIKGLLN
jgi:hypothetical protein